MGYPARTHPAAPYGSVVPMHTAADGDTVTCGDRQAGPAAAPLLNYKESFIRQMPQVKSYGCELKLKTEADPSPTS